VGTPIILNLKPSTREKLSQIAHFCSLFAAERRMPRAALAVAAGAFAALEQKCWTMQARRRMATLNAGHDG
jgi:hypothetical protein